MRIDDLVSEMTANRDDEQAAKMSAYMQDKFPFLGIPRPKLKQIMKPYIAECRKQPLDWEVVYKLWNNEYREAIYVALEYIEKHKKQIVLEDFDRLKELITTKSWWETVDQLDAYVGDLVLAHEELKDAMLQWSKDENMWIRRVSIDYQQRFKENTDVDILAKTIENNLGSKEFFINKAIGWSLREYSKTDAQWVKVFLADHETQMDKLSIREAKKYL